MSALYNRAKSSAKAGCVHLEQPSRRTPEANRRDAAEYEAALNSGDAAKAKDVYKRTGQRELSVLARVLPYDLVAFPDPMRGRFTTTFFRPETESKFARAQDSNICKADIRVTKQGSRTPKNRFAPKLRHDAGASSGSDGSANSESSESESGSDSDSDTEESDTDQATGSGAESGSDHDET